MRGTIHRWRIGARMSQLPFLSGSRAQSDAQKLTLLAFSDSIGVLSINSERIPHSAHSGMDWVTDLVDFWTTHCIIFFRWYCVPAEEGLSELLSLDSASALRFAVQFREGPFPIWWKKWVLVVLAKSCKINLNFEVWTFKSWKTHSDRVPGLSVVSEHFRKMWL